MKTRIRQILSFATVAVLCGVGLSITASADDAQASVVAGGMATITRTFPPTTNGYNDIQTTTTITAEPGNNGNTYWANQWGFAAPSSEGGYVGLQQRSGTDKYINFSIWGASGWRSLAPGTYCRFFGHEGSGVQCDMPFAWTTGITYMIAVERVDAQSWRATITDPQTAATTAVATIELPDDRGGISWLSQWVENFSQGSEALPNCEAVPRATAVFGQPFANGGTVATSASSTYTYGVCASMARSVCSSDQSCTLAVAEPAAVTQSKLQNAATGYCLDLLGGGTAAGLWTCASNTNQLVTHDSNFRLAFSELANTCLTVGSNDGVQSAACDATAKQQWLPIPRTNSFWNAGTGTCLDAVENSVLSTPLRVYACTGTIYQQWNAIA